MGDGNFAILLTPPGAAAIAVVRVAGPAVGRFLARHFSKAPRTGRAVHGELSDGAGNVIDDPVVVLAPDGAWADLNLHGGAWVVRSVMELARAEGFEVSESPGVPLPETAVDGADVLEREVLAYLPLAKTELALRTLLAQPAAWQGCGAAPRRAPLPPLPPGVGRGEGERKEASESERPANEHQSTPALTLTFSRRERGPELADRSLIHLLHPPRVAIVGAANVGKSTLANQLFAQERSITADRPGTTRDWVGEIANLDGLAVLLVDTPGVRQTDDAIERAAIERSGRVVEQADLVVVVLDATRSLEPEQAPLLRRHPDAIRVVNKADQLAAPGAGEWPGTRTVATTGQGVGPLRAAIRRRFLGDEPFDPARPRWWTERQRKLLEDTSGA
jgi:tRNA modification GTPase